MTHTDAVASRDKERTRRAILDAADRMLSERGSKASLTEIAKAAGVTQSGLRHHFPTRDDLVNGIVEHTITHMWEQVHAHIDLSENRPGKFIRGYIRALTSNSHIFANTLDPTALSAALGNPPALAEQYARDAQRWAAAFADDGLPTARVLVIQHAAEGLSIARSTPYLSEKDLALARDELLAMTETT